METLRIAGRRYSDPDILSLARESGGLIDPRFTIINKARLLLRKLDGLTGVPRDALERLKILASLNGIKVQPMDVDHQRQYKRDAVVFRTGSGWTILYNPNRLKARIVFTLAHEIAHTLFPNSTSGARFRSMTNPDSREANELERLCDLGAAELAMPLDEFQRQVSGEYSLSIVDQLASHFGTSFEATAFRLASAHPGFAVAGLLRYRLRVDEERRAAVASAQRPLFRVPSSARHQPAEKKYRRQSLHLSSSCGDEYLVRWNKSFETESVVYKSHQGGICRAIETLPNQMDKCGRMEAVLCPFQREDADGDFGDLLFFWEELV